MKTTNYYNTFIEVAEDCPVDSSEVPLAKGDKKTIAQIQFEMISRHPYQYTSDDVVFHCYAERKELTEKECLAAREEYFSKGQACLRASPLPKRYGWGIHSNADGKVALYPIESEDYLRFLKDETLNRIKAMRSKRA